MHGGAVRNESDALFESLKSLHEAVGRVMSNAVTYLTSKRTVCSVVSESWSFD